MYTGRMRHKVYLMQQHHTRRNGLNEDVPVYRVYHPGLPDLFVSESVNDAGQAEWNALEFDNAQYAPSDITEWAYWAEVKPMTGRSYEEMQKIRAETTYNVYMRYLPGVTTDMYVMYGNKKLKVESVLDTDERHKILNLVSVEEVR